MNLTRKPWVPPSPLSKPFSRCRELNAPSTSMPSTSKKAPPLEWLFAAHPIRRPQDARHKRRMGRHPKRKLALRGSLKRQRERTPEIP